MYSVRVFKVFDHGLAHTAYTCLIHHAVYRHNNDKNHIARHAFTSPHKHATYVHPVLLCSAISNCCLSSQKEKLCKQKPSKLVAMNGVTRYYDNEASAIE